MLHNIERNELGGKIMPFRFAVTGKSNEIVRIPIAASPKNRISRQAIEDEAENYESVGAISLHDIFRKENISCVDLLKVDCEGSEYDIIAATDMATFAKIREIVLEYHDDRVEELVDALKNHGFHLAKHRPESGKMGMLWFNRD
jgi:FkbM family methyltransferase